MWANMVRVKMAFKNKNLDERTPRTSNVGHSGFNTWAINSWGAQPALYIDGEVPVG